MKISELKNAPEWLVLANTENADVEFHPWIDGWIIWNGGDFLGGDFLGGDFLGGNFLGGNFRGGNFLGGNFLGGDFLGGDFRGGNFLGGDFLGGNFRGGNFLGGLMMPHCKWIYGQDPDGNIIIGCKRKTLAEWDAWFAGTEVFSTPRDTPEFKKIQACFEATKAFMNFLKK